MNCWKIATRSVRCYLADSVFLAYLEVETLLVKNRTSLDHSWEKNLSVEMALMQSSARPSIEVARLMWM